MEPDSKVQSWQDPQQARDAQAQWELLNYCPPRGQESIPRAGQSEPCHCAWIAQQKTASPVWDIGPGAEIILLPLSSFLEAGLGWTDVSNLVDRETKPEPEQHNLPLVSPSPQLPKFGEEIPLH